MILAYVFWHRAGVGTDASAYEQALRHFHAQLREKPVSGLLGSHTERVRDLPWLPHDRKADWYQDWYVVDGWEALGALNSGAVDADHVGAHDVVAVAAGPGTAGLYALLGGTWSVAGPARAWFAKPVGTTYAAWHESLGFLLPAAGVSPRADAGQRRGAGPPHDSDYAVAIRDRCLWQRQLVLGPAPEYCFVASEVAALGEPPVPAAALRSVGEPVA